MLSTWARSTWALSAGTFLQCLNDLNAIIGVAKTCDVALLLVDSAYGFETFEFPTACRCTTFRA